MADDDDLPASRKGEEWGRTSTALSENMTDLISNPSPYQRFIRPPMQRAGITAARVG